MSSQGSGEAVLARVAALDSRITVVETKQSERHPMIDGRLERLESVVPITAVRLGGLEQSMGAFGVQIKEMREEQKANNKDLRADMKDQAATMRGMQMCIERLDQHSNGGHAGRMARAVPMVTTGGVAGAIVSAVLVILEVLR